MQKYNIIHLKRKSKYYCMNWKAICQTKKGEDGNIFAFVT